MYSELLIIMLGATSVVCAEVKSGQLLGLQSEFSGPGTVTGLFEVSIENNGQQMLLFSLPGIPGASDISVSADGTLYAVYGNPDVLYVIDLANGSATEIGEVDDGPIGDVVALSFSPKGILYGYNNINCTLITIDIASADVSHVGVTGIDSMDSIVFGDDGRLYGAHSALAGSIFWELDPNTGQATEIGPLGNGPAGDTICHSNGLTFIGDTLYSSASTDEKDTRGLYTIDVSTGDATFVGPFDAKGDAIMQGLAFFPGAGDTDRDGDVDFDDYETFAGCHTGPLEPGGDPLPVECVFLDSDDDSDIDCIDWEAFIPHWTEDTEPPTFEPCDGPALCEGDANGDGVVDPFDSGYVQARFGCFVNTGDAECDAADVNNDAIVDPLDVGYVLSRFGECP